MQPSIDILIVDDDTEITNMLSEVLTDEGYSVCSALSGAEALSIIRSSPPVLVLLDYWMPVMTGAEVIARLRSGDFPTLPIVLMSANARAETLISTGATAFLAKPFNLDALIACVAQYTRPENV
jgi:CheY-like chemotaxis protein